MVRRYHFDLVGIVIIQLSSLWYILPYVGSGFKLSILYSYCYSIGVLNQRFPDAIKSPLWHFSVAS